ncbi:hypothetical protein PENTCL1PPCAC_20218, partial [Pristionchus entomophagus]
IIPVSHLTRSSTSFHAMSSSTNKPRSNKPIKSKVSDNELKKKPQPNTFWAGNSINTANKFEVLLKNKHTTEAMSLEDRGDTISDGEKEKKKIVTSTNSPDRMNSKQRRDLDSILAKYPKVDAEEITHIFSKSNYKSTLESLKELHGEPIQETKNEWKKNESVKREKKRKSDNTNKYFGHYLDLDTMICKNGGRAGMELDFKNKMTVVHQKRRGGRWRVLRNVDIFREFERLYAEFSPYLDNNVVYMRHLPTKMAMDKFKEYEKLAKRGSLPTTVHVYHGTGNDSTEKPKQDEQSANKNQLLIYLKNQKYSDEQYRPLNTGVLAVDIVLLEHL